MSDDLFVRVSERVLADVQPYLRAFGGYSLLNHMDLCGSLENLPVARVENIGVLLQVRVVIGQANHRAPVIELVNGLGIHVPAYSGRNAVFVLEENEIVSVLHHGLEEGWSLQFAPIPPKTLDILQQEIEDHLTAGAGLSCEMSLEATNPAVGVPYPDVE